MTECRSCKAKIWYVEMENGKMMPLNWKPEKIIIVDKDERGKIVDGYISHFKTCPHANEWRKK